MSDFTVREYAFLSVAYEGCPKSSLAHAYIPEKAFEHLCELSSSFSKHGAKVFELAGRRKLKLDQYVGGIETPCGTRIEILPKHVELNGTSDQEIILEERKLLQKMLGVSLHLPYREAGSANLNRFKQPLHEWIITQFLAAFERLVQRGLRFDYNRVQEEQKFLRGQLQYVKYMRQSPAKKHIFPIEHDVYEVNRPENRLIRTALEIICKKTKDASNWKLAQELRLMTSEIPRSQKIQQDLRQWQTGRLLALYAEIKPWTELILGEYMPVSTQGEWRGMSLLFPMEKLFEHFVAYHLRLGLPEYQIKTQHATEHICEHETSKIFKLKPDIFIDRSQANAKSIVMDTKWKLIDQNDRSGRYGLKDNDIQQMFAYSHYYLKHESEVILVYPYRAEKFTRPLDDFDFRHTEGAKLRVVPFNLDEPQNFKII
ncbi:mcrBC 5-methylcytosine restriction system component family protein [Acinetobacter sp. 25977_1]|uniref:McrC family protein n=1 Tax=unclassified Acinetobacter calcoaceticus/baumannii complex TaxID=2881046 RepID=UPI000445AD30|nr:MULTISPECIES: McrC family protein [unclassified Acinetobacter calcoaceticus/baumannii complex]EXT41162.1 mcrBC 5-methylcytosine restriction system component family protein [Acinetobacter sp. 25977_8]EXT64429.1 mcrBC 5-methylcytosine restriction system component family protein [Acinetobacter sp. 25977_1]